MAGDGGGRGSAQPPLPERSSEDSLVRKIRAHLPREAPPADQTFFRARGAEPLQPAPGLAAGKIVGEFRLVALLGQGGMGQVWEAEQLSLHRRVAVKFVRPERVTEKQLELFAREARAGGRLSHPGIVGVHAHGTSDGLAWIAMEHVSGAWTLRDFLDEVARAGETPAGYDRQVARLVIEIATAMQAAHEAGVIHRDLKPQNVLITPDDHPKVTDFGLARITDETALSQTGDFAGTYFYMSPEQVTAKRIAIDHRTDVFSLGIVLYELLALRRPFEGDTTHQVAEQIVMHDPVDPRTIRSKVPRDLAVIAGKALEKSRDKRYTTMGELAADLERFLADEPIRARPPGRLERAWKWARRNPAKSSVAAVVGLALVVISALLAANVQANRRLNESNVALAASEKESELRRIAAERAAAAEKERADEVLRLSDLQDVDTLVAEASEHWPARPELIGQLSGWMERARALVAKRAEHAATLAELRRSALPDAAPDERGAWGYADDAERWWDAQLAGLIAGLDRLEAELMAPDAVTPAHGWSIGKRLAFAERMRAELAPGGELARAWEAVLPAIRDDVGTELGPQVGLVPLGQDPESGLWEFADMQTGVVPVRGANGRLVVGEESALVFVLVQGGSFLMGSQSTKSELPCYDRDHAPDEGPAHEVTLSPYFLAKHELSQAQWLRLMATHPSHYSPSNWSPAWNREMPRHIPTLPVENVTWTECARVCRHFGWSLPSEAQWEFAARAESESPWWFGDDPRALATAGNIADQRSKGIAQAGVIHADWDDGAAVVLPVDAQDPNPLGLHGMLGNVWEWCADGYFGDAYAHLPDLDPLAPTSSANARVRRGGSFMSTYTDSRSANRGNFGQESAIVDCGLRPARAIER